MWALYRWISLQLLAAKVTGQYRIEPFIIGGHNADEGRFRFIAALYTKEDGFKDCGGSLITQRHVLTAGHCVSQSELSQYQIVLGQYDIRLNSGSEQRISVTKIWEHKYIDAAIIVLAENVTLGENATIVELATQQEPVGTWATAMGWGRTKHSTSGSSAYILQTVNVPIANSSVCSQVSFPVKEHEICCGDPDRKEYTGTCHGDSGSPLVYPANSTQDRELVQIGITARGVTNCPSSSTYAAFVSVPVIYDWIVCHSEMLEGRILPNSSYINCSKYNDNYPETTTEKRLSSSPVADSTSLVPCTTISVILNKSQISSVAYTTAVGTIGQSTGFVKSSTMQSLPVWASVLIGAAAILGGASVVGLLICCCCWVSCCTYKKRNIVEDNELGCRKETLSKGASDNRNLQK